MTVLNEMLNALVKNNLLPEDAVPLARSVVPVPTELYRGYVIDLDGADEVLAEADTWRWTRLEAEQDALRLWLHATETNYADHALLSLAFSRQILEVLARVERALAARCEDELPEDCQLATLSADIEELHTPFGAASPMVEAQPIPQAVDDNAPQSSLSRLRRHVLTDLQEMAYDLGQEGVPVPDPLTVAGLQQYLEQIAASSI
jgi:hypothetical protein